MTIYLLLKAKTRSLQWHLIRSYICNDQKVIKREKRSKFRFLAKTVILKIEMTSDRCPTSEIFLCFFFCFFLELCQDTLGHIFEAFCRDLNNTILTNKYFLKPNDFWNIVYFYDIINILKNVIFWKCYTSLFSQRVVL